MSSVQEEKTPELRMLYRDVQLEVLRLKSYVRKVNLSGVKESLKLLEQYEKNLKYELVRRGEDI